ncbi:hypothetical protein Pcinc_043091 [Petrolisthes cinctipes]|uniref:Uncharacterized protein n=1 Tax=Petrolisthes cinctipes TaxID=88211 RepID=A0AAE1BJE7_PETCI|nr:hypothetical protein Pcinc_043091 [Petrolisthes cinctipes]
MCELSSHKSLDIFSASEPLIYTGSREKEHHVNSEEPVVPYVLHRLDRDQGTKEDDGVGSLGSVEVSGCKERPHDTKYTPPSGYAWKRKQHQAERQRQAARDPLRVRQSGRQAGCSSNPMQQAKLYPPQHDPIFHIHIKLCAHPNMTLNTSHPGGTLPSLLCPLPLASPLTHPPIPVVPLLTPHTPSHPCYLPPYPSHTLPSLLSSPFHLTPHRPSHPCCSPPPPPPPASPLTHTPSHPCYLPPSTSPLTHHTLPSLLFPSSPSTPSVSPLTHHTLPSLLFPSTPSVSPFTQ